MASTPLTATADSGYSSGMPLPQRQFEHITTLRTTRDMILQITRELAPRETIAEWLRDAAQQKLDRLTEAKGRTK